ncbi:MAG: Hsp33 family molecular chaperone HslO [Lysobacterales bacterium]
MNSTDRPDPNSDCLRRFVFEGANVRGVIVRLDEAWRQIQQRNQHPPAILEVLGEMTAASALLAGDIQMAGHVSVQLSGRGALRLAFAECRSDGDLRAIARAEGDSAAPLSPEQMHGAVFAITIDRQPHGARHQGLVPTEGERLAQFLEAYFTQSEQLPTAIWLFADGEHAAGLLLQQVPGAGGRSAADDALTFEHACILAATVSAAEMYSLDAERLLGRLFADDDLRLYDPVALRFQCACSRERVAGVLRALGRDEAFAALDDDGWVTVDCEFCNQRYRFDAVDLEQALQSAVPFTASASRQ